MKIGKEEIEFIKNLIDEKIKVDISTIGNYFYQGIITGVSKNSIILIDKYNEDVMVFLSDIKKIARYREKEKTINRPII